MIPTDHPRERPGPKEPRALPRLRDRLGVRMGQGRFQGSSGHVPQRPGHRATLVRRARPKRHERVGGGRRRRDEEVLKHLEIHIVPAVLPFSCPRFSGSWIYLIGTIRINLILVQILPKNNPRILLLFVCTHES